MRKKRAAGSDDDAPLVRSDLASLRQDFLQFQRTADERHRQIITHLDGIVTLLRGQQGKLTVHDVHIAEVKKRVDSLESRTG